MSDAGPLRQGDAQASFVERLAGWIAILGGLLALAIAMLVVISVLGRWLSGIDWAQSAAGVLGLRLGPINGDFEMVQMATAIAVFAFLPYTQARRGNILVDTFTGGLPAQVTAGLDAFWALVYAGMMGVLSACLTVGTIEHYRSGETTMLLQIIVWPAIAISTLLLLLLTCVALATVAKYIKGGA
ncbi:MAG: TRAP transporter small permease subunit [Rhodospirillales bacterium]|nr:TRAP transporter small permease subunit [Rhodospirillales bacterium]